LSTLCLTAVRDRIVEIIQLQLSPSKVSSHFSASGHVVAAVPLALHYAGQLAGTVVRATGVPHELFSGVEGSEEIFQIARRFA
jgi:hypothetical protein